MPTTHHADTGRTADSSVPTVAAGQIPAPGTYLTNEAFLYRVVDVAGTGAGATIALEDCHGLDVVRVPLSAVRASGLRVVTPAPARG